MTLVRDKIMETDEIGKIEIEGKGNFKTLSEKIPELISSLLEIPKSGITETKYVKREENVMAEWSFMERFDKHSYAEFFLTLEGNLSTGEVKISLKSALKTEVWKDSIWQKNYVYEILLGIWYELIYSRKRKKYLEEAKNKMSVILKHLKTLVGE